LRTGVQTAGIRPDGPCGWSNLEDSVRYVRWQTVRLRIAGAQCGVERTAKTLNAGNKPGNKLIELLPRRERLRLLASCDPVELKFGATLAQAGKPISHVYFPVDGFVSLVTALGGKPVLEVGMVGREGMVGTEVVLGVLRAPTNSLVQGAGLAQRMSVAAFRRELSRNEPLKRGLNRYLYVRMTQFAVAAACLRFHLIGHRLARWLLMTQDRAHADHFRVTHEFLAYMLGVRRVGVTIAAGALQGRGLISYSRGQLIVLDRRGLENAACECYASDRHTYQSLIH